MPQSARPPRDRFGRFRRCRTLRDGRSTGRYAEYSRIPRPGATGRPGKPRIVTDININKTTTIAVPPTGRTFENSIYAPDRDAELDVSPRMTGRPNTTLSMTSRRAVHSSSRIRLRRTSDRFATTAVASRIGIALRPNAPPLLHDKQPQARGPTPTTATRPTGYISGVCRGWYFFLICVLFPWRSSSFQAGFKGTMLKSSAVDLREFGRFRVTGITATVGDFVTV
jgi:hypothetical protein